MTWNPDDPKTRPAWRSAQVLAVLRGMQFDRDPARFVKDKRLANHFAQTIKFACGCLASDDDGWTSCGEGIHAILSDVNPESATAQQYRLLRTTFDFILEEAWRRRGGQPENYYEFHEALRTEPFLRFEKWRQTHDLLGQSVWQNGLLYADVQHVPQDEHVVLSPESDDVFGLQFIRDGEAPFFVDEQTADVALKRIFAETASQS